MDLRILGHWTDREQRYGAVRDGLFARAVAVRSAGRTVCLVALDLIGDAIGLTARVRERIAETAGIPGERVMVVSTHTHASPETIGLTDHAVAAGWMDSVSDRAAEAVKQAVANLAPCRLVFGEGNLPAVAVNRAARDNRRGMDRLDEAGRRRYSVLDEKVRVAAFCREDGSIVGTIFSFACHPVCVQSQGFISADWPGAALRRLEARHPSIFVNGACGDADPVRMRGYEAVEWTGEQVALKVSEVLADLRTAKPVSDPPVRWARRDLTLARRDVGPVPELEREERDLQKAAADEEPNGPLHERLFDVREELALARKPERLRGEIQCFAVGPLVLVGIPGEPVACLGEDIRRSLPERNVWVIGYANGYLGYVVSRELFEVGGYEAWPGRWSPLAPGEGERLRDEVIALAKTIEGKDPR
jgi:hypothetical protein